MLSLTRDRPTASDQVVIIITMMNNNTCKFQHMQASSTSTLYDELRRMCQCHNKKELALAMHKLFGHSMQTLDRNSTLIGGRGILPQLPKEHTCSCLKYAYLYEDFTQIDDVTYYVGLYNSESIPHDSTLPRQ